jgi:nicotinamidase-related amidase
MGDGYDIELQGDLAYVIITSSCGYSGQNHFHKYGGKFMTDTITPDTNLTDADDSILIVIDVQQAFLEKLDSQEIGPLGNRIAWITEMAGRLDIPIIVTAEDTDSKPGTVAQVAEKLPPGTKEFNKMSYGLCGDPEILSAVKDTGRKTAVLVGLETDVCICQSALGLLQNGLRVVVLSDAVASPGPCQEQGIERMRNAGVIISSVKGTFYEWQRTVQCGKRTFGDIYTSTQPKGIYL